MASSAGDADQAADLGDGHAAAPEQLHHRRHRQEYEHRPDRADDAGAHAQPQEVALELAGDEAVGGADEVQHLDDLAVGRHGALGGRDDDGGGGGADQQQDGEAAEREGAGDGADLLLPAAVIVERDALELLGERRPHRVEVRRGARGRARWRSGAAREAPSARRSVRATARAAGPRRRCRARARWRCPAARDRKRVTSATTLSTSLWFLGFDLHRHLAGDVAQPGVGRLVHHVDGAGRQAGEKAHDGDDEGERAAGDRAGRNDRRRWSGWDRRAASGSAARAPPASSLGGGRARPLVCVDRPVSAP